MLTKNLRSLDYFWTYVNFFYKGNEYFSTGWGQFVTIFVTVAYLALIGLKFTEFFGETDPITYFSETRQDVQHRLNLSSLGFSFALENVDADLGTLEAHQVHWSGSDGVKIET